MSITVTGQRSELGRVVSQKSATRRIHVNVAGQPANMLFQADKVIEESRSGVHADPAARDLELLLSTL